MPIKPAAVQIWAFGAGFPAREPMCLVGLAPPGQQDRLCAKTGTHGGRPWRAVAKVVRREPATGIGIALLL
jgi:hypothetical protein